MWVGRFVPAVWIDGFDQQDPLQAKMAELMVSSVVPQSARVIGAKNDREQYRESAIESWALESITVPTLVLHGDADSLVPYANAQVAAARIPSANLITIEGGGHFMYVTKAKELSEHVMNFINSTRAEE
jgi:pimeloyl-ACP methyl ester carboxylesterase